MQTLDYDFDTGSTIAPCFEALNADNASDDDGGDNYEGCDEKEWIDEGDENLEGDFCDAELLRSQSKPLFRQQHAQPTDSGKDSFSIST